MSRHTERLDRELQNVGANSTQSPEGPAAKQVTVSWATEVVVRAATKPRLRN